MTKEYNKINVLEGVEGIRANMGMYIGSTTMSEGQVAPRAVVQAAQEIMSNSFDENVAGFATEVQITLFPDGAVEICDDGRGVPEGKDQSEATNAFTKLHASGKGADGAYANSGVAGMHGVGGTVVNAGSEFMNLQAKRSATGAYFVNFSRGLVVDHGKLGDHELHPWFDTHETGTVIKYKLDAGPISEKKQKPVFESILPDVKEITLRAQLGAMLNPGLVVTVINKFNDDFDVKRFEYEKGLTSFFMERGIKEKDIVRVEATTRVAGFDFPTELVMAPGKGELFSFANGLPTREGGPHVEGFRAEIGKAFVNYRENRVSRAAKSKTALKNTDILDAADVALHIKIPADIVEFEGQTKEKLGAANAKKALQNIVKGPLTDALFDYASAADKILKAAEDKAAEAAAVAKAREQAKKMREAESSSKLNLNVSSKLKPAKSKNPAERELYLVEGDSASEIGRDLMTQAVLPLRGKPKNVVDDKLVDVLSNLEWSTIIATIGAGVGPDFDPEKSQYHKIIIASDADYDGFHIRSILLGCFAVHCPGLIESGRVYFVKTPLYKATKYIKGKPESIFLYSVEEHDEKKGGLLDKGYAITRFKGLGEMKPNEAHVTLANKETRQLQQVTVSSPEEAEQFKEAYLKCLSDKKSYKDQRREWILNDIGASAWSSDVVAD